MKTCFKCGVAQSLTEFYACPRMADGRLNKCKECTKRDVQANYAKTRAEKSAYEQERSQRPERKSAALGYQRTRRSKHPEKCKARQAVSNAVRDKRLAKQPCEVCGTTVDVEAHHHDYSKPLDVQWLCFKHHRADHGQIVSIAS